MKGRRTPTLPHSTFLSAPTVPATIKAFNVLFLEQALQRAPVEVPHHPFARILNAHVHVPSPPI